MAVVDRKPEVLLDTIKANLKSLLVSCCNNAASKSMMLQLVVIFKRLKLSIGDKAEACLQKRFRTAHIPVLKSWDEVHIEVWIAINHVNEFVSCSSHQLYGLWFDTAYNFFHKGLVFVMGPTNSGVNIIIANESVSRKRLFVLWYRHILTDLMREGNYNPVIIINREKSTFRKSDISPANIRACWILSNLSSERLVHNSHQGSFINRDAYYRSQMFSVTFSESAGSI